MKVGDNPKDINRIAAARVILYMVSGSLFVYQGLIMTQPKSMHRPFQEPCSVGMKEAQSEYWLIKTETNAKGI